VSAVEELGLGLAGVSRRPEVNARRLLRLHNWLAELTEVGTHGWVSVWSDTARVPAWDRGGRDIGRLTGAQVLAVIEALAAEQYVVRRVVRAGADVRSVEVWLP
jgi:hypothetical protein